MGFLILLETIFWLPLVLAFIVLCLTTFLIERTYYGPSLIVVLALVAGFAFLHRDVVLPMWEAGTLIGTAAKFAGYWVLASLVTGFLMWLYIIRRAARFVDDQASLKLEEAFSYVANGSKSILAGALKTNVLSDYALKLVRLSKAADAYCTRFGVERENAYRGGPVDLSDLKDMTDLELRLQKSIEEYFPPRAFQNKWNLIGSALAWPSTLLWLAVYGILNEIWHFAFKLFRNTLDLVSTKLFPSMGLKTADEIIASRPVVAPVVVPESTGFGSGDFGNEGYSASR